jgi:hypothetical protein
MQKKSYTQKKSIMQIFYVNKLLRIFCQKTRGIAFNDTPTAFNDYPTAFNDQKVLRLRFLFRI